MRKAASEILILYGSQTGQAESIAEIIFERMATMDLPVPRMLELNSVDKECLLQFTLPTTQLAVIICSSTGDGDPPDNAGKFYRKLHRKTLPKEYLAHLRYTLLGLGDTNYNNYLKVPTSLNNRLQELGATQFYPSGFCDDAVGLDLVAEPWMDDLYPALVRECSQPNSINDTTKTVSIPDVSSLAIDKERSSSQSDSRSVARVSISKESEERRDAASDGDGIQDKASCSLTSSHPFTCFADVSALSLKESPSLADVELSVPVLSPSWLVVEKTNEPAATAPFPHTHIEYPSQASPLADARVLSRKRLTAPNANKEKYELIVELAETIDHKPGDAFYFICPNPSGEVNWLLRRLGIDEASSTSEHKLSIDPQTTKKKPTIPQHLPAERSLVDWFTWCLDLRKPVGKILLRALAHHTSDADEQRRLLELVSREGRQEYHDLLLTPHLSVLDVLHAFPSCQPPVNVMLEHLPRLGHRSYSVASWDSDRRRVRFVYSLVGLPAGDGRFFAKKGIATGHLTQLSVGEEISVYLKKPTHFHLPESPFDHPLLLIGPGTGLAPFLGFLEYMQSLDPTDEQKRATKRSLFFGCRSRGVDDIYCSNLSLLHTSSILTDLRIAQSQANPPRYVQDLFTEDLVPLLRDARAMVYVCGDASGMANGVYGGLKRVLESCGCFTAQEAKNHLESMKTDRRYIQDIW